MRVDKTIRVMWLLNHRAAREFEIPMLKKIGISEIFLPKIYPNQTSFRSANVDWSEDKNLTIPAKDLELLNSINWYQDESRTAWQVANHYFDVCFFIFHDPATLKCASKYFEGALLWRTYGNHADFSHSKSLASLPNGIGEAWLNRLGRRFFLAKAYDHTDLVEKLTLRRRSVFLPLGLHQSVIDDKWEGRDSRIFFVCPDIAHNTYYMEIYQRFVSDFSGLPYVIGGAQPILLDDPAILGFVPTAVHEENMRQMRLMFYHSTEPNHVHYHPFEAVRVGMPLVFMAGGMLDRLGGENLPGRCKTVREARDKISAY